MLLPLLLGLAASVTRAEGPCDIPGLALRISGGQVQEQQWVCRGAAAAADFFRAQGLLLPAVVHVQISSRMPAEVSDSAAGCFLEGSNTAYLIPYATFRRFRTWFGVPIDGQMYQSLATHGVAHALAACNFAAQPSIQAKEYVAYVVMFDAMAAPLRARLLARYVGQDNIATERVTQLLYLFDPMKFGVFAYAHFSQPPNGIGFVRAVLAGQELAD